MNPLRRWVKQLLQWSVRGPQFKRYTRPNAPAEQGDVLRIAICHLIPSLGDSVMLFPLLDALHKQHPDAEITCFTSGMGRVLHGHPALAHSYHFERRGGLWRRLGDLGYIHDLWAWWRRDLREMRFDLCVVLRGGVDPFHSAHLAWLLGGRERVGYADELEPERNIDNLQKSVLLTRQVETMVDVHEISRCVEILRLAGLLPAAVDYMLPSSSLLAVARGAAGQEFVSSYKDLQGPYVVIAPGASLNRREWPPERFQRVAEEVASLGWLPVFIGGPEVAALCDAMGAALACRTLNLAGRTDFEQLTAVCAEALCLVGNDSGTAHIAGACGVPTVVVSCFAKTGRATHHASLNRSRPIGALYVGLEPPQQVPPCMEECIELTAHCIREVTVEEVVAAFRDLMARAGRLPRSGSL
jgi:ADP-heptose:LPS heptosyltransferase